MRPEQAALSHDAVLYDHLPGACSVSGAELQTDTTARLATSITPWYESPVIHFLPVAVCYVETIDINPFSPAFSDCSKMSLPKQ